jgi:hypothetical protein
VQRGEQVVAVATLYLVCVPLPTLDQIAAKSEELDRLSRKQDNLISAFEAEVSVAPIKIALLCFAVCCALALLRCALLPTFSAPCP